METDNGMLEYAEYPILVYEIRELRMKLMIINIIMS